MHTHTEALPGDSKSQGLPQGLTGSSPLAISPPRQQEAPVGHAHLCALPLTTDCGLCSCHQPGSPSDFSSKRQEVKTHPLYLCLVCPRLAVGASAPAPATRQAPAVWDPFGKCHWAAFVSLTDFSHHISLWPVGAQRELAKGCLGSHRHSERAGDPGPEALQKGTRF